MIAGIRGIDVPAGVERHALRIEQSVVPAIAVPCCEPRPGGAEFLQPIHAAIDDIDVAAAVNTDPARVVKLPIPGAGAAPTRHVDPRARELLNAPVAGIGDIEVATAV